MVQNVLSIGWLGDRAAVTEYQYIVAHGFRRVADLLDKRKAGCLILRML